MKTRYSELRSNNMSKYDSVVRGYLVRPIRSEVSAYRRQILTNLSQLDGLTLGPQQGLVGGPSPLQPTLPSLSSVDALAWPARPQPEVLSAYNSAYDNFRGKVGSMEEVGTSLAELTSTIKMAQSRATQIDEAWYSLRHRKIGDFFNTLGVHDQLIRRKHRSKLNSRTKSLADASELWLEYWFGWAPLMGDIYSVPRIVTSFRRNYYVSAGSSVPFRSTGSRVDRSYDVVSVSEAKIRCHMVGKVLVSSPSLHLAKNLGASPHDILWNLVPFSWMADWFFNMGQIISSIDDWVGLSLSDFTVTLVSQGARTSEVKAYNVGIYPNVKGTYKVGYMDIVRATPKSFPQPRPQLQFPDFSLTRLATTLSMIGTRIFK